MRFLLLVLLFGLAAALPQSGFYRDEGDGDDIKTELGKKLKEHLEDVLAKIKDAIDHGRDVKEDLIEKAKEIKEKLKDLHIEIKGKLKELFEKAKNRFKEWLKNLWEKDNDNEVSRRDLKDLKEKFNNLLCRLKDKLQQRLDEGKIEAFIREKVSEGKFLDFLIKWLHHGKGHLKNIVDFLADKCDDSDDEVSRRSITDKVKEAIRKLKQMLQDAVDKQTIKKFIEDHVPASRVRDILLKFADKSREQFQKLLDLMDRGDD